MLIMNAFLIRADWNILKGKLKQAWALLTGNDVEYKKGQTREFLGRIQKKTGEKRAAIQRTRRECEELWEQIDPASKGSSSRDARHKALLKEPCCSL